MPKKISGVTSIKRKNKKGVIEYWYANLGDKSQYCGMNKKGYEIAKAAKSKQTAKKYEDKEVKAGLKVKRMEVETFKELSDWYMLLPTVQEQKSYQRKIAATSHLFKYFGKRRLNQIDADEQERYREYYNPQSVMRLVNSEKQKPYKNDIKDETSL